LAPAGLLYNGERVGKAVRTPARDSMLAHASAGIGRGYAFGLHEVLDQTGAMAGPLLIAAVLALGGNYRLAFALLALPGVLAVVVLLRLRGRAPDPTAWEPSAGVPEKKRLRLESGLSREFWQYAAFSAATMLGFSTWAVLAFHLTSQRLLSPALVPVLYAAAMAAAAVAALGFGRIYDRAGLRGLIVLPFLAAAVPLLSLSTTTALFVAGAVVWGAGMGVHDSTMRAAVADLVPAHRRVRATGRSPRSTGWPGWPEPPSSARCTSGVRRPPSSSSLRCRRWRYACSSRCCAASPRPRRREAAPGSVPERSVGPEAA